jgi:uncharacterized phage protein (TIGR01671 family)
MSESKFRVWHKELKQMFWIDLAWGSPTTRGSGWLGVVPFGENLRLKLSGDNRFLTEPENCELQHYIGKLDKHNNEICEGDVIEGNLFDARLPTMGKVIFDTENSCYASENLGGITFLFKIDQIKVIGNIYENPELITTSIDEK